MIVADPASLPVLAMVEQTKETFAGELRGEELVIRSSRGGTCRGRVRFSGLSYGSGHLSCADGRFGSFSVHMAGGLGTAYGRLGSQDITLTFG